MGWRDFQNTAPVDLTDKIDFIPPGKRFNQLNPFNPPRVDSDKPSLVAPDTDPATATEPCQPTWQRADALITACEGVTNPKISIGLHPYRYRLKNDKGGGTYLTPAATLEEARDELERRYGKDLLLVSE